MSGCFDHVGLDCHLYSGGVIEVDKALYGSFLQEKVKRANKCNLRGRRFGLGKEDESFYSDVERPPENAPTTSPTMARAYVTEETNLVNSGLLGYP